MLGKLMKYECKGTYKIVLITLLVVAGATLLGILGSVLPFRYIMAHEAQGAKAGVAIGAVTMVAGLTFLIYVFSMVGATYTLYGYQGYRFYKTMYTDEGYLTHTLPVKPGQILFGKLMVAGGWAVLLNICVVCSVILLGAAMFSAMGEAFPYLTIAQEFSPSGLREIQQELIEAGAMPEVAHALVSMVVAFVLGPFGTLLMIFGGLTIGQLSRKHKLLLGILAFVGILFVNSIVSQFLRFLFALVEYGMSRNSEFTFMSVSVAGTMDANTATTLLMGGLMYFITYQILSKKLNLD